MATFGRGLGRVLPDFAEFFGKILGTAVVGLPTAVGIALAVASSMHTGFKTFIDALNEIHKST